MLLTMSDGMSSYLQFITVLIIFVFVLAITLWTTRWIAGYQKSKSLNANMELIESFRLTNNKYIQIIRVGQKYLAVAIGRDSVTMLTEIPEDQLVLLDSAQTSMPNFKELLQKVQQKSFLEKEDDRNKNE